MNFKKLIVIYPAHNNFESPTNKRDFLKFCKAYMEFHKGKYFNRFTGEQKLPRIGKDQIKQLKKWGLV